MGGRLLWLLSLWQGLRAVLLRRRSGGGWPLKISTAALRRLSARQQGSDLRDRSWSTRDALVVRRGAAFVRHCVSHLGRGRTLHRLRLIVLSHYGVLRLVLVVLALKHLLLLHARISIPRILSLVGRQRGRRGYGATIPCVTRWIGVTSRPSRVWGTV